MSSPEMRALALRIVALEEGRHNRAPQLAFTTLEAGAIVVTDEFDALRGAVGVQFDGSVLAAELAQGPAPLQPTTAALSTGAGSLKIRWDGLWTDGLVVPMNFTRVEIHVSETTGFAADTADTLFGTFETPRGGEQSFAMTAGVKYVRLVARNLSGARGPASVEASIDVPPILGAEELEGIQTDVDAALAAASAAQTAAAEAETAADAASATAAAVQLEVDGIPAEIATAKAEAISAAELDAQDRADLAQAAAIAASIPNAPGSVTATLIADDAVTTPKIFAGAVIAGKLAANAVIAGNIAADAVTTTTLAADAVTATKLAVDAVIARNVKAGEIIAGKLAASAVIAGNIAADAVTTSTLVADAVTAAKIAVDAILARNIKAGEVVAGKLAALSVVAGNIAADAVTANTVAAGAIEAGKLAAGAVIAGNIAAGAVTATTIAADAIDGKVITGATLRTAASGGRIVARPGVSSIGFGNGILELFSGNVGDQYPAEIYTISDGPAASDNTSLYIMSPKKTGYSERSFLQLFASDLDSNASIKISGAVVSTLASNNVETWVNGTRRLFVDGIGATVIGSVIADDFLVMPGYSLPRGIVGWGLRTASTATLGTSGATSTEVLKLTDVSMISGRRYKISFQFQVQSSVANDRVGIQVNIGGALRYLPAYLCPVAGTSFSHLISVPYVATSTGATVVEIRAYRSFGTGNAIIYCSDASKIHCFLEIEDIGKV